MKQRKILSLLILFFTLSVSVYGGNIKDDPSLKEEKEGILITRINTFLNDKLKLTVVNGEFKAFGNAGTDFKSTKDNELIVIKLPSGNDYWLRTIYYLGLSRYSDFERGELAFVIVPGTINYIGDIEIIPKGSFCSSIRVTDKEAEVLENAKSLYPKLFEKYPYQKRLVEVE